VEEGACTLRLGLFSDTSCPGIRSWVELWRLGLAETAEWTAGDQLQATARVGLGGHVFADLPPGRYRAMVYDQRATVADPPAFDVEGARTERTLFTIAPRWRRAYLRVYTETGDRVTRAAQITQVETSFHRNSKPDWAQPRRLKNGGSRERRGSRETGTTVEDEWGVVSTDRGFEFLFREAARRTRWNTDVHIDLYQRSDISVDVTGDRAADRDYVGVAVSLELLYGLVLMPDGSCARNAGARFDARSVAVPVGAAKPYRSIPVSVTVGLAGYEKLQFTYRVDRPPAKQLMRPKPVSEPE
jgi:hypothetical protein